jgi:hypothetical protein
MRALLICPLLMCLYASAQDSTVITIRNQMPLTNQDVIQMVKARFPDAVIIKAIATRKTQFDVSTPGLTQLKNSGVGQPVMEAMLSAASPRVQACSRFPSAMVMIYALYPDGRTSEGSGFLIDGWVFTAGHVLYDESTHQYLSPITVTVRIGRQEFDFSALPQTAIGDAIKYDFTLLKLQGPHSKKDLTQKQSDALPSLELGDDLEVPIGSEVTLIGVPSSAGGPPVCLFGTIAAKAQPNIVYGGVSIKGMSGGPIISLDSGKVIGMITGIDIPRRELQDIKKELGAESVASSGTASDRKTLSDIIQLLERHLNNGIGVGVTATFARSEIEKAKKTGQPQ